MMELQEPNQAQSELNQLQLPNSTGVLVMGILSIVCFCCIPFGLASLVLGILALVLGNKAMLVYKTNPEKYTIGSFKNANAGKVCGIVGLSLGGLWFLGFLLKVSFITMLIASIFSFLPWDLSTF